MLKHGSVPIFYQTILPGELYNENGILLPRFSSVFPCHSWNKSLQENH
jgi:hypothetical protein